MTRFRRVASVGVIASMLVVASMSGALGPAAVGTASAASSGDCSGWQQLLSGFGFGSGVLDDPCAPDYEAIQEADENETRTTIHSTAGQLSAGNEQFLTVLDNYGQDTDTVAFSKGEAAAVEALANGATVSEARAAANESIADYYTVKQRNLADRWNVAVETVRTTSAKAQNTSGVDGDFVTTAYAQTNDFNTTINDVDGSSSVSTVNGSMVVLEELNATAQLDGEGSGTDEHHFLVADRELRINGMYAGHLDTVVVKPTTELSSATMLRFEDFHNRWDSLDTRNQQKQKELAKYVSESLAPAMESGNLNATSYVSPATLAQEYANENRSYVQAVATASMMGFDVPDLENTNSMTISYNGSSYTGFLFSQNAPSGGWEQDQTYDPSLLGGAEFFASVDNGTFRLDGPFTITSIENTDGQQIEKVHTENITYQVSNASANYSELQEEIRALNEQIEQKKSTGVAGPGGDSGSQVPPWAVGAGAAASILALLAAVMGRN